MSYPATIAVDVTEADIRNGVPRLCTECMVALAIQRQFPEQLVAISHGGASVITGYGTDKEEIASYQFPPEVGEQISRFDFHLPVDPFNFVATLEKTETL